MHKYIQIYFQYPSTYNKQTRNKYTNLAKLIENTNNKDPIDTARRHGITINHDHKYSWNHQTKRTHKLRQLIEKAINKQQRGTQRQTD